MRSRIPALAYKELLHVVRDWRTLLIAIALPIILLVLFGYGITFDIDDIPIAVWDEDNTPASRELVERIVASPTFTLSARPDSPAALRHALDAGDAAVALHVRAGYQADLATGNAPDVQLLVDGAENNTGMLAMGYLGRVMADYVADRTADALNRRGVRNVPGMPALDLRTRFWFNPELKTAHYVVPGVIALVMMLLCTMLTALTIVRERERGTIEQLIATPVKAYEIVIGKLLPYFGLGLLDTALITLAGMLLFGLPLRGSVVLLALISCLFALVGLGVGLLISTIARNQVFALQLSIISQMLPAILLSGFMFPIKEMPVILQYVTLVVPARYALIALRGIFLKGAGMAELWPHFAVLAGLAAILLTAAAKRFRKRLNG